MAAEDLVTGKDIAEAVLEDMGELASVAAGDYVTNVKRYVREAYWDLLGRHKWEWAMSPSPGVVTTEASVPVSVTGISGDTVTLSATIATTKAGFKFFMDGNNAVYRVLAHTAGTNILTLDGSYVEPQVSGAGTLYQDEYPLASTVLKVWGPMQVRGQWWQPVPIVEKESLELKYGKGWSAGPAPFELACQIPRSSAGLARVRFAPWSEERVSIEYDYTMFHNLDFSGSAGTDTPKVPQEFRGVIADLALFKGFTSKDDNKATDHRTLAENTILEMVTRFLTPEHGQLVVRPRNSLSLGCN